MLVILDVESCVVFEFWRRNLGFNWLIRQLVWRWETYWENLLGTQHGWCCFKKSCSTGLSIYHHSLVVLLVLLMDKHLCDTRTMANFRYSLPSSAGASAAYHGISVKCNSTSTNPPTDFLRLKLDFASMALIRHNLIPRPKTLRSTNMTSFFLPSLLIIKKKKTLFNCQLPAPLCQPTGGKKRHASRASNPLDANFWRRAIPAAERS